MKAPRTYKTLFLLALTVTIVLGGAAATQAGLGPAFLTDCPATQCATPFGSIVGTCTFIFSNGTTQTCRVKIDYDTYGGDDYPFCYTGC